MESRSRDDENEESRAESCVPREGEEEDRKERRGDEPPVEGDGSKQRSCQDGAEEREEGARGPLGVFLGHF